MILHTCNFKIELFPLQDINECEEGSHDCHIYAICTNLPSTYSCRCETGFIGNGTFCECKSSKYIKIFTFIGIQKYAVGSNYYHVPLYKLPLMYKIYSSGYLSDV